MSESQQFEGTAVEGQKTGQNQTGETYVNREGEEGRRTSDTASVPTMEPQTEKEEPSKAV